EEQVLRLAPRLSRRNYLCIALRGPHVLSPRRDGGIGYSWGPDDQDDPLVEEDIFDAIRQTRRGVHLHSQPVYLARLRAGAALAYRQGLLCPDRFAGVASLNGTMPGRGGPLMRLPEARKLRVFIGHGIANAVAPLSLAKKDYRLFYSAGMGVQLRTYPT